MYSPFLNYCYLLFKLIASNVSHIFNTGAHKQGVVSLNHTYTKIHTSISTCELIVSELSHYYCTYPVITHPLGMVLPVPWLTSGVNSTLLMPLSNIVTHTVTC